MESFISATLFIYIVQFIVVILILAFEDAEDIGITNKTQVVLYLTLPYYFVYTILRSAYQSIKKL